jgi:multidrug transporter EmrE-like cation transporter
MLCNPSLGFSCPAQLWLLHRTSGGSMTGWVFLGLAIVLEVVATSLLKLSDGLARWEWAAASILFYALCFLVFAPSLKTIPVGVAYAVWSGVGIVAITVIGLLFFDERLSPVQLGFMALVLIGAVGLQVSTRS